MKPEPTLFAQVIHRGWLVRALRVSGELEAEIEYDGRTAGFSGDPLREIVWHDGVRARVVRPDPMIAPLDRMLDASELQLLEEGEKRSIDPVELWRRHRLVFQLLGTTRRAVLEVELTRGIVQLGYFKLSIGAAVLYEEARGKVLVLRRPPPLPIAAEAPSPDPDSLPIAVDGQIVPE